MEVVNKKTTLQACMWHAAAGCGHQTLCFDCQSVVLLRGRCGAHRGLSPTPLEGCASCQEIDCAFSVLQTEQLSKFDGRGESPASELA